MWDFPGNAVDGSLPADAGSIPGLGGFHMPQSRWVHVLQLLSLHSRAG